MGRAGAIWILLAAALALRRRRLPPLLGVVLAIVLAEVATTTIKLLAGRPRPYVTQPEPAPLVGTHLDLTLPSGHAATSFAGALVLALAIGRRWAAVVLFTLAAGIACSRVYVGVHYPSDVLAGAALGLAAGAAAAVVVSRLGRPRLRSLRTPGAVQPRSRRAPPPG